MKGMLSPAAGLIRMPRGSIGMDAFGRQLFSESRVDPADKMVPDNKRDGSKD